MKKLTKLAVAVALLLAFAAPAHAAWWGKAWQWRHHHHHRPPAIAHTVSVCPVDGADKAYTIVNAGVTGVTLQQLAAVMQATRDESFALRLVYGTPCAWFGPGGIPVYLSDGYEPLPGGASTYQLGGFHSPSAIYVQTGRTPYTNWVRAFSHEIIEHLVDPSGTKWFGTYMAEVCDPVENLTYEVDQLRVSDFVTPAWFNQSSRGPWDAGHYLSGPA